MAGTINRNLARACHDFGMGMGLGSCRMIMDDDTYFEDFNVRPIIGDEYPLYANLGIAQIEEFIESNKVDRIRSLLGELEEALFADRPIQDFDAWKKEFKRQVRPRLFAGLRRRQRYLRVTGLPSLNPAVS